jgi:hypothetical protein
MNICRVRLRIESFTPRIDAEIKIRSMRHALDQPAGMPRAAAGGLEMVVQDRPWPYRTPHSFAPFAMTGDARRRTAERGRVNRTVRSTIDPPYM